MHLKTTIIVGLTLAIALQLSTRAQEGPCNDDPFCVCDITFTENEGPGSPPCYDDTAAAFIQGSTEVGCCNISGCMNLKSCRYKVSIVATAKAGSTCNFLIVGPGDRSEMCNAAGSCTYMSDNVEDLPCNTDHNYQVKADGVVVWSAEVKCVMCAG